MVPVAFCAPISRAQNQSDRIAGAGRQQGGRDYSRAAMCSRCEAAPWPKRGGCEACCNKKTDPKVCFIGTLFSLFFSRFQGNSKSNFRGSEGVT